MTRQFPKTYLVVFDGEQDEALRVLLQQWFIGLLGLDTRRNCRFRLGLDQVKLGLLQVQVIDDRYVSLDVLFVGNVEVEFFSRRVRHLEAVNSGCCLYHSVSSHGLDSRRRYAGVAMRSYLLRWSDLCRHGCVL